MGCEQSRRDDLEGVMFTILYFLKGSLPWQGLEATNKHQKVKKILESKQSISPEELCAGYPGNN